MQEIFSINQLVFPEHEFQEFSHVIVIPKFHIKG